MKAFATLPYIQTILCVLLEYFVVLKATQDNNIKEYQERVDLKERNMSLVPAILCMIYCCVIDHQSPWTRQYSFTDTKVLCWKLTKSLFHCLHNLLILAFFLVTEEEQM